MSRLPSRARAASAHSPPVTPSPHRTPSNGLMGVDHVAHSMRNKAVEASMDALESYEYGDALTERCSTCGTPVEGERGEEWCVQCAAPAGDASGEPATPEEVAQSTGANIELLRRARNAAARRTTDNEER